MNEVLEKNHNNTDNEHLDIIKKEKLKDVEKRHSRRINYYEILIAITMSIYGICDDMSYIDAKNVAFAFLAYLLFSMVQIKIVEKVLGHIFQRSMIRDMLNSDEKNEFIWKYKVLKKSKR